MVTVISAVALVIIHGWMQFGATLGFVLDDQCTCPATIGASNGYKVIPYQKLGSTVNVMNPGRGFYHQEGTNTSQFHKLTNNSWVYSKMDGNHINVVLRIYFLTTYIGKDMDAAFTNNVRADMEEAKRNGWSVILRFAYNEAIGARDNNLRQVLQHIHMLNNSHVFQDYEGIIAAIQAGFIGAWGEWHSSTSDFGEINSCDVDLSSTEWSNRKNLLEALLNAVPKSIEICVRRPLFKYGIWGKTSTTLQEDESMNDKSRIAYHNDAFLNGDSDEGTFRCPNERENMENDSLYNVVIGETNSANQSIKMYGCPIAKQRLAELHFSMLNGGYNENVTNRWKSDGCYPEIAAHLGYRLFLKQAVLPPQVKRGEELCYKIDIGNDGYAAPHKDFEAHLMLKNSIDGHRYSAVIPMDTRRMQPGATYSQKGSVTVPATLPNGDYQVLLVILHKAVERDNSYNMKYNVLLANGGNVQDTARRENNLKHTITITSGQCSLTTEPLLRGWPASIGRFPVSDRTDISTGGSSGGSCQSSFSIKDGSFESGGQQWQRYSGGFTVESPGGHDGTNFIQVTDGGARQVIDFSLSPVTEFYLSGYSRFNSGSSVSNSADYSIYCDVTLTDGSSLDAQHKDFPTGSSGSWHQRELHVVSSTPIREAWCYAMFRHGHGSADFDQFKLTTCAGCPYSLKDGSFEGTSAWTQYQGGYTSHGTAPQDGSRYIRVANGGAEQDIHFDGAPVTEFTLSGYSRAHYSPAVTNPDDYSIYCDLVYTDGNSGYGKIARFSILTSWHNVSLHVKETKPIKQANCYAMFRNGNGDVDFDNFKLESCA
ncbi:uncharacterized protein LOC128235104 [Mya arenaria]|uniref:uncharacterized protein LOC128235104 n=1 Tax=Mya arenaria TaxID=6604 RepID=UPI0022DF7B61|nr:uncharacterized protein LOC128235104 [Mya arenaria]